MAKTNVKKAPAPSKKKASKSKQSVEAKNDVKAEAVEVVQTTEVESHDTCHHSSSAEDSSTLVSSQMKEFMTRLQEFGTHMVQLKSDFRLLEKNVTKELKAAQRSQRKKKKTGNRQPSGFVKPTLISTELAEFLNKPDSTESEESMPPPDDNFSTGIF